MGWALQLGYLVAPGIRLLNARNGDWSSSGALGKTCMGWDSFTRRAGVSKTDVTRIKEPSTRAAQTTSPSAGTSEFVLRAVGTQRRRSGFGSRWATKSS